MGKPQPRRSQRLGTYDANGRDYLSFTLGWSRVQFEEWIYSPTVRPHLQAWSAFCIANSRRFNDAVDWINTGPEGYFYNDGDLEEDLLLLCLDAGDDGCDDGLSFVDDMIDVECWITQELWARTAWRIVNANRDEVQVFREAARDHPAAAYAFTIEMLCVMFHSVAFREGDSVYMALLDNGEQSAKRQVDLGEQDNAQDNSCEQASSAITETASGAMDSTFKGSGKNIPMSERSTIIVTPAPEHGQLVVRVTPFDSRQKRVGEDGNGTSSGSIITSPDTRERRSEGAEKQLPLTPDTGSDIRHAIVSGNRNSDKTAMVRMWLESTVRCRRLPVALGR